MLRAVVVLGVLFTWLVPAGFSHAGLAFEFALGEGPSLPAFTISGPGQSVNIQVYLSQYDVAPGEPVLSSVGLSGFGVKVAFDNPSGIAEVAAISGNSTEFGSFVSDVYSAELSGFSIEPFVLLPTDGPTTGRILLGTFIFAGLTPGATTIGVTEFDSESMVTGLGDPFSGITPGSATLTVTPEPGSVALSLLVVGAASVVTSYRARRQRKSQAANAGGPGAAASL